MWKVVHNTILVTLMMVSLSRTMTLSNQFEFRLQAMESLSWLHPGWVLAFRLTDGVQQSAYDTFLDSSRDDDRPLARGFLPLDCLQVSGHCDRHYHSGLLNDWPSAYIDQVRMSVWKDGGEVAYVLFNGTGSTKENWFSKDRIISSSWTDLIDQPSNYFSLEGHIDTGATPSRWRRVFFINRNYGGCPVDRGWLSVHDQNYDVCPWGRLGSHHPYPAILYSKLNTSANFNTRDVGRADVLTVAVKFRDSLDTLLAETESAMYMGN